MHALPEAVQAAIHQLTRLPGVGRRAAERIVTHLLESPADLAAELGESIATLRTAVRFCERCGNWSGAALCAICADPSREPGRLCVVERPPDLVAFEQSGAFHGRYHVLGGTLSPLRGVTPERLSIDRLLARVREESIAEVIVATSPTVEGDATALYLARALAPLGATVERIGVGLPLGASLGYADPGTLKMALEGRRKLE